MIRLSTERPEAVEAGFAKVVATERDNILTATTEISEEKVKLPIKSPFGDGDAGEKIAQIVKKELTRKKSDRKGSSLFLTRGLRSLSSSIALKKNSCAIFTQIRLGF